MFKPIEGVTIIGIGYRARQGKDTLANGIIDRLGSKAQKFGFADDLKAVARVEHGMTVKDPKLLQHLGTEVYRERDPLTWIRALYYKLDEQRPKVAIIPDVRFPNEAEFIKQLGGKLVKVVRMNQDGSQFQDPARNPLHPSETSLNGYHEWDVVVIANSGRLDQLDECAEALCGELALG